MIQKSHQLSVSTFSGCSKYPKQCQKSKLQKFGYENSRIWKNVLFNLICKYLRAWVTKKKYEAKESVRECQEGEKASLAHVKLRKFVQPSSDDVMLYISRLHFNAISWNLRDPIRVGRQDTDYILSLLCVWWMNVSGELIDGFWFFLLIPRSPRLLHSRAVPTDQ